MRLVAIYQNTKHSVSESALANNNLMKTPVRPEIESLEDLSKLKIVKETTENCPKPYQLCFFNRPEIHRCMFCATSTTTG